MRSHVLIAERRNIWHFRPFGWLAAAAATAENHSVVQRCSGAAVQFVCHLAAS